MTPERMAALVAWWVRRYTRGLPAPIARRRVDEIAADVHDHVAHERAQGSGERRIALGVLSRAVRGAAADTSWRAGHRPATPRPPITEETMTVRTPIRRSVVRVALGTALVLLVPLIATLVTEGANWGAFDFALAAVLFAGIGGTFELAARRAGRIPYRAAVALALGVAAVGGVAMVLGETDDAPGLVIVGILLVIAALTLAVRTVRRST